MPIPKFRLSRAQAFANLIQRSLDLSYSAFLYYFDHSAFLHYYYYYEQLAFYTTLTNSFLLVNTYPPRKSENHSIFYKVGNFSHTSHTTHYHTLRLANARYIRVSWLVKKPDQRRGRVSPRHRDSP